MRNWYDSCNVLPLWPMKAVSTHSKYGILAEGRIFKLLKEQVAKQRKQNLLLLANKTFFGPLDEVRSSTQWRYLHAFTECGGSFVSLLGPGEGFLTDHSRKFHVIFRHNWECVVTHLTHIFVQHGANFPYLFYCGSHRGGFDYKRLVTEQPQKKAEWDASWLALLEDAHINY